MSDRQGGATIAVGALIATLGAIWSWQMFHDAAMLMGLAVVGLAIVGGAIVSARNDRTQYGKGEQLLAIVILFALLYALFRWGI